MLTLPMASDPHKLMKELFGALMRKNPSKVIELYKTDVQLDGNNLVKPSHLEANYSNEYPLTTSHDTVLHIAMCSGQNELVEDLLLHILSTNESDKLLLKVNDFADTILHEATTTGEIDSEIISLILSKEPRLLEMRNKKDESPLFRAARFGNKKMFKDLANRVDPHPELHWNRTDGVNILHIAIHNEFFDLALDIARRYPGLLTLRDQVGVTALQLLSSMPLAFKSGCRHGWLRRFIYFCAPNSSGVPNLDDCQENKSKVPPWYYTCIKVYSPIASGWVLIEEVWKEKERHEFAFRLAKYLIICDDYLWKESDIDSGGDPRINIFGAPERNSHKRHKNWQLGHFINMVCRHLDKKHSDAKLFERGIISQMAALGGGNPTGLTELEPQSDDTLAFENSFPESKIDTNSHKPETHPLLIATSNGIEEIVEGILELCPQAIDHVSYTTGQNILHVAVMKRQKRIFDIVKKKEIPMKRLARRIDKEGNTGLHQVGNVGIYRGLMPGPALQLQEELLWFKRVKDVLPSNFRMHLNNEGYNALDFFQENHKHLLQQAQDWLKRTSQSCSVVAVLIATVAFAAAYTVPGGNNDSDGDHPGLPILIDDNFFLVFTVMDVISLASSLTSVVMFLSILTSPFQFQDFKRSLPRKLTLGFTFLFMAVATMMLAFAATIILTIRSEKYMSKILIYTVAFLPVSIFALLQFPLYLALTHTAQYSLIMLKSALPSCCIPPCLKAKNSEKKQ